MKDQDSEFKGFKSRERILALRRISTMSAEDTENYRLSGVYIVRLIWEGKSAAARAFTPFVHLIFRSTGILSVQGENVA